MNILIETLNVNGVSIEAEALKFLDAIEKQLRVDKMKE